MANNDRNDRLVSDLRLAYSSRDYRVFRALSSEVRRLGRPAEASDLDLSFSNRDDRVFRALVSFLDGRLYL